MRRAGKAFVDRLARGETFIYSMPVFDSGFAQPPAQQHQPIIERERKIEQANIEVFDLNAGSINFGERIFDAPNCLDAKGTAIEAMPQFYRDSAGLVGAFGKSGEFILDLPGFTPGLHSLPQQAFKNGQERGCLGESEGAVSHEKGPKVY